MEAGWSPADDVYNYNKINHVFFWVKHTRRLCSLADLNAVLLEVSQVGDGQLCFPVDDGRLVALGKSTVAVHQLWVGRIARQRVVVKQCWVHLWVLGQLQDVVRAPSQPSALQRISRAACLSPTPTSKCHLRRCSPLSPQSSWRTNNQTDQPRHRHTPTDTAVNDISTRILVNELDTNLLPSLFSFTVQRLV